MPVHAASFARVIDLRLIMRSGVCRGRRSRDKISWCDLVMRSDSWGYKLIFSIFQGENLGEKMCRGRTKDGMKDKLPQRSSFCRASPGSYNCMDASCEIPGPFRQEVKYANATATLVGDCIIPRCSRTRGCEVCAGIGCRKTDFQRRTITLWNNGSSRCSLV